MVKFCERTDTFHFSWDQVARAFWFRYPNPYSSHVQTEDVICRRVQNGLLYTKRLLTKTVRIPLFGKKLTIKNEPIIEESVIDPVSKTITTYTWNIGLKYAVVEEKCVYKPSGEMQTGVQRQAWIASRLYFSRAFEAYMTRKFRKTINKTCMGLHYVLENMFTPHAHQESKPLHFIDNGGKLREKTKKAAELAKSKAVPLLAACSPNQQ